MSLYEFNPCSFIKLNIKSNGNSLESPQNTTEGMANKWNNATNKTIDWPDSVVIMAPLDLELANSKTFVDGSQSFNTNVTNLIKFLTIKEEAKS